MGGGEKKIIGGKKLFTTPITYNVTVGPMAYLNQSSYSYSSEFTRLMAFLLQPSLATCSTMKVSKQGESLLVIPASFLQCPVTIL